MTLPDSRLLRTRLLNGGEWSALQAAEFYVEPLAAAGDVVISEIHYHPYEATLAEKAAGPKRKICAFIVDAANADVVAYEPIWLNGDVVGFCTSGGYSHWTEQSVALGFLPSEAIQDDLILRRPRHQERFSSSTWRLRVQKS